MRSGVYGKLPAKRDFVAESLPDGFLAVWEPWLQSGLAASQSALGARWREVWMTAPIWRFWLGPALCGRTVAGVVMPSIDGVGRCFPLTAVSAAGEGEEMPPPLDCADDPWFGAIEDILLGALDDHRVWDDVLRDIADLPGPSPRVISACPPVAGGDGWVSAQAEGDAAGAALARCVAADLAQATCWWTIGGAGVAAQAVLMRALPEPAFFERLLTGGVAR